MFKNKITYLLAVLLLTFSCNKDENVGNCQMSLFIESNEEMGIVPISKAESTQRIFSVKIYDSSNKVVASYDDHTQMPQTIVISPGAYKVVASSKNNNFVEAAFDSPIYYGETNFSAIIGQNTNVKLSCSHSLVKVSVGYSEELKSYLSSYKTVVSNGVEGGELTFDGDDKRVGYFKPTSGKITYTLHAKTKQGEDITATNTINVKAADYLDIKFGVNNDVTEDGDNTIFDIVVDETLNEVLHRVDISMSKGTPTSMSVRDLDISQPIFVYNPVQVSTIIDVSAPEGIAYLGIKFNSDLTQDYNLPINTNLLAADGAMIEALNNAGITFTIAGDNKSAVVDLTVMTSKLSYFEEGPKDHLVDVVVYDQFRQFSNAAITFRVLSKQHKAISAELFSTDNSFENSVLFRGQYTSDTPLNGMTFVYKESTAQDWIIVDPSKLTIDSNNKEFSCSVNLPVSSKYLFRTAIIKVGAVSEVGDGEIVVNVVPVIKVPNLGFDEWHLGSNQYPNASDGNSFWATGNEGLKMASKPDNTIPVTDDVVKGKAVRMESISVPIVNFAAGNLFTGSFKTNILNPAKSVTFGRPFTGRPTHLAGYYKYSPADYNGGKDYCHIYILLENRNSGTKRVGYVELLDNKTTTEYQYFKLKIDYTSEEPVTHITLVATSSKEGGAFKGGVGSVLMVDEFDLLYVCE